MDGGEGKNPFDLYVTHVKKEHGLVKIYGQTDLTTAGVVEKYLKAVREQLEGGHAPQPSQLSIGQSVITRLDGTWYRTKIVGIAGTRISLQFLDYGGTEVCNVSYIRTGLHSQLQAVPPLADEYVLGEVIPPAGDWSKPAIEFVKDALIYNTCKAVLIYSARGYNFVRVYKREHLEPLVTDMVQCGMAISGYPNLDSIPPGPNNPAIASHHNNSTTPHRTPPQAAVAPTVINPPGYTQYGPHTGSRPPAPFTMTAQSRFPPSHGSAGRGSLPAHPPYVGAGGYTTGAGGIPAAIVPPSYSSYQPTPWSHGSNGPLTGHQTGGHAPTISPGIQPFAVRPSAVAGGAAFRSLLLDPGVWYNVFMSSIGEEDEGGWGGPGCFSVQLEEHTSRLDKLMADINDHRQAGLRPLPGSSVQPGTACLARYTIDNTLYRAVIEHGSGFSRNREQMVRVLYVDFGNSEELPVDQLYQLPERFINRSETMSIRCQLFEWPPPGDHLDQEMIHAVRKRFHTYLDRALRCRIMNNSAVSSVQANTNQKAIVQLYDGAVDIGQELRIWLSQQTSPSKNLIANRSGAAHPSLAAKQRQQNGGNVSRGFNGANYSSRDSTRGSSLGLEFSPIKLSGSVDVYMSSLGCGPELFYVHRADSTETIDSMMREIAAYMAEDTAAPLSNNELNRNGTACLAQYTDLLWYRARIVGGHKKNGRNSGKHSDTVKVEFVDFGNIEHVRKDQVKAIRADLVDNNKSQAIACCLSGLQPLPLTTESSEALLNNKTTIQFQECVRDQKFRIKVVNEINSVYMVKATVMKNRSVINVNKEVGLQHDKSNNHLTGPSQDAMPGRDDVTSNDTGSVSSGAGGGRGRGRRRQTDSDSTDQDQSPADRRVFDQNDLRISLRERRAARELTLSKPVTQGFRFPKLFSGMKSKCKVSWMFDPGHFYVQLKPGGDQEKKFELLMEDMQIEFLSGPYQQKFWQKGTPVAAKFHDGCWYRGLVENTVSEPVNRRPNQTRPRHVQVFFVDFGNTDIVDPGNVVGLPAEFGSLEVQSFQAGLAGVEEIGNNWELLPNGFEHYFSDSIYKIEVIKVGKTNLIKLNDGKIAQELLRDWREAANEQSQSPYPSQPGLTDKPKGAERGKSDRQGSRKSNEPVSRRSASSPTSNARSSVGHEDDVKSNADDSSQISPKRLFTVGGPESGFPSVNSRDLTGVSEEMAISHAVSWRLFWVQRDPAALQRIADQLAKWQEQRHEEPLAPSDWKIGDSCVCSWEGKLYRAVIESVLDDSSDEDVRKVTVHFVDHGNSETISCTDIWRCDSSLLVEAPQALKCRLDSKLDTFQQLFQQNKFKLHLKFKNLFRNQFTVKLDKKSQNNRKERDKDSSEKESMGGNAASKKASKEKRNTKEVTEGISVQVTHVETVHNIWYVKGEGEATAEQRLQEMASKLAELTSDLKPVFDDVPNGSTEDAPRQFDEDKLYLAYYEEDIYRVRIVKQLESDDTCDNVADDDQAVEVHYVDYGNSETIGRSAVYRLTDELQSSVVAPLAAECRIKGAEYALDCDETRQKLLHHLTEGTVRLSVESKSSDKPGDDALLPEARLWVNGKQFNLQLLKVRRPESKLKSSLVTSDLNLFQLQSTVRLSCFLTDSEPSGHAWIVGETMIGKLEKMMAAINMAAKSMPPVKKIEEGKLVCCPFSEDGAYYRARIIKILEPGPEILVHYIDYGNRELVNRHVLLSLNEEFRLHPGYAMKVEVDTSEDCKILTGQEVTSLVAEGRVLVCELTQPTRSKVRLFLAGQRIGFLPQPEELDLSGNEPEIYSSDQPSDGLNFPVVDRSMFPARPTVPSLPPPRLRLGSDRLAVVTGAPHPQLFLQDLRAAKNVLDKMESSGITFLRLSSDTPAVTDKPKPNTLYLAAVGNRLRRVVLTSDNDEDDATEGKDSFVMEDVDSLVRLTVTQGELFSCPSQLLAIPPAAFAVVTSSSELNLNRFILTNTLARMSVTQLGDRLQLTDLLLSIGLKVIRGEDNAEADEDDRIRVEGDVGKRLTVTIRAPFGTGNLSRLALTAPQLDSLRSAASNHIAPVGPTSTCCWPSKAEMASLIGQFAAQSTEEVEDKQRDGCNDIVSFDPFESMFTRDVSAHDNTFSAHLISQWYQVSQLDPNRAELRLVSREGKQLLPPVKVQLNTNLDAVVFPAEMPSQVNGESHCWLGGLVDEAAAIKLLAQLQRVDSDPSTLDKITASTLEANVCLALYREVPSSKTAAVRQRRAWCMPANKVESTPAHAVHHRCLVVRSNGDEMMEILLVDEGGPSQLCLASELFALPTDLEALPPMATPAVADVETSLAEARLTGQLSLANKGLRFTVQHA